MSDEHARLLCRWLRYADYVLAWREIPTRERPHYRVILNNDDWKGDTSMSTGDAPLGQAVAAHCPAHGAYYGVTCPRCARATWDERIASALESIAAALLEARESERG